MGLADSMINWRFQEQESKRQRAFDQQMYDVQNRYNSPQSQMERYRAAGLNPNLMYGQGNSGNAAPAQAAKYQKNPAKRVEFDMLSQSQQAANVANTIAQTENIKANTKNLGQNTQTEEWNTELAKFKASMTQAQYQDFQNQMTIRWGINDDGTLMSDSPGAKKILSESQTATAEARIRESKARIQKQMEDWFKANNMAKMIPAISGLLRLIK